MNNKILVIEDDPALAAGLKELLLSENYKIIYSSDGREGLRLAMKHDPDLVLLDISLPYINGMEVCRLLREKKFINPIIMLTSRSEPVDKVLGLEAGADNYISKPFNSHELLAHIRSHLRQRQRHAIEAKTKLKPVKGKMQRRLLTIMFSDMKDYSKIMSTNETLALKLLGIYKKIVEKTVVKFKGEIIEAAGDSHLATFDSALRAVECASAIQNKLKADKTSKGLNKSILVRIGIHLGDVIVRKDNIKGDSVNIAARIQQNASPGKVLFSESVYQVIKNKTEFKFKSLGEFRLKNIEDRVRLYELAT